MKDELKKSLTGFIESKKLNREQLNDLDMLINTLDQKSSRAGLRKYNMLAAMLLVVMIFSVIWNSLNRINTVELIAEEVAYNHLKMKPMEVHGNSLSDMREYFSELEFNLSPSKFAAQNGLKLIGGRYCSIQGESAAQLRLQDTTTGDIQMIYQAPYNKDVFRKLPKADDVQQPHRYLINGIEVEVWAENGVLFARSKKYSGLQ